MQKMLWRYRRLVVLLVLALVLKLLSYRPDWVERGYTYGVYPGLSRVMRLITGWVPFSLGDVLYALAGVGLLWAVWRTVNAIQNAGIKKSARPLLYKMLYVFLIVYTLFNGLWGLNYYRLGIAYQLRLPVQRYNLPDVLQLTQTLQSRLNHYAAQADTIKRKALNDNSKLFQKAITVYHDAAKKYPYLRYRTSSIKPSLYSGVGHYFGFTGYYNPFSSEAQIKTSIPVFLKLFVATHEIAHQLGYAKENEANFVAYLSSRQSGDAETLYSVYYHMYAYAVNDVYRRDSALALRFRQALHPQVVRDNETYKAYLASTNNNIEPLVSRFYDQYLKWNNQKSGVQTYNQVVALLIAYGKKYGWAAI
jgi:hypothetical protein